jgi:hypothetical protein
MPIRTLLARIRRLVPSTNDDRYEQIADGFAEGTFRAPVTPMTDQQLAAAISEFLKNAPGHETNKILSGHFDLK